MTVESHSIVFCGYNWEGENILNSLIQDSRFNVTAVVIPKNYDDSFVGGIKSIAKQSNLNLIQGIKNLEGVSFDLGIMTAYPYIFSDSILKLPKFGWVGNHHSLLPKYRGFHPIQWALKNEEKKIGTSLFLLDGGADTGPIIFQSEVSLREGDDYESVRRKLHEIVIHNIANSAFDYLSGTVVPSQQDHSLSTKYDRFY